MPARRPTQGVPRSIPLNELSGPKIAPRDCEALQPKEGKLVEVATLEDDPVVEDLEEAAATQAIGVAPFKDGPVSILEDVLDQARHRGPAEFDLEHLPDGRTTTQWLHHDLVVDRIIRIERREPIDIGIIEASNPLLDELPG